MRQLLFSEYKIPPIH